MVRSVHLLVAAAAIAVGAVPASTSDCIGSSSWIQDCGAASSGSDVELDGQGSWGSTGSGPGPGSGGGSSVSTATALTPCIPQPAAPCHDDFTVTSDGGDELVTISDIASFRPHPAIDRMQPDGWTIVGLDTNFIASAGQHVVSGTLLGRPADVRFTPIGYSWSYGDGASRASGSPGATWEALGLPEFEPTATSHVYGAPGSYLITLRVTYRAEYRFDGSGWAQVVGTLTVPANDLVVTVGSSAKTVLVDEDCLQNPSGPGC